MASTVVIGAARGNRTQLARALVEHGVDVAEAACAQAAAAYLDAADPPSTALVDLDGLGQETGPVFQALAEHGTSVVALTRRPSAVATAGLAVTPKVYTKPVSRTGLQELIQTVVATTGWP